MNPSTSITVNFLKRVHVFYYELNHFAMAIAGEVSPDVSAPDAYTFMQILDAFYDSAKSGEKVYIARRVAIPENNV